MRIKIFPLVIFFLLIAEIYILILVGQITGVLNLLLLIVVSAFVGIGFIRKQGFATLIRGRERIFGGELPTSELVEGLFLVIGGICLLMPGFISDCLGITLAVPFSRKMMIIFLEKSSFFKFRANFKAGSAQSESAKDNYPEDIIDAEFWDHSDQKGIKKSSKDP